MERVQPGRLQGDFQSLGIFVLRNIATDLTVALLTHQSAKETDLSNSTA